VSLTGALADLRPLITDDLRPGWERWVDRLFARHLQALGLEPRPRESDDSLRLRPGLVDFLAVDSRDAALHAGARRLALRWLEDRAAVDGSMVESILAAAARRGDRELFDRLVAAVPAARDRRERRALYVAIGSFGDPAIARSALALVLDPAQDYRDASQIAWTMSGTPRGSAIVYAFMKENFDALVARAPLDSAAYYPRFAGNFCSEEGRADVAEFFRERSKRAAGGPRLLAQTLERISLCTAFKERQQAALTAFLRKQ
jgi:alanyl aminopeptidase